MLSSSKDKVQNFWQKFLEKLKPFMLTKAVFIWSKIQ